MFAEGFFQPLSLPCYPFLIVRWWGAAILEVCNDVLAGLFEKIATGPFQASHFNFLFSWRTVVNPFLGEDHESSPLQNSSRVSIGYVAESWENHLHEDGVGDLALQGCFFWLFRWVILVVEDNSELVLNKLGCSPALFQNGLLVTNVTEGLLLFDDLAANFPIII